MKRKGGMAKNFVGQKIGEKNRKKIEFGIKKKKMKEKIFDRAKC